MPNFSTPSGSTQPYIPAIHRDQRNRVPGTVKVFADLAEMNAAVVVERSNIALGLPVWFALETLILAIEPIGVERRWNPASPGDARTAVIGIRTFPLLGDSNIVRPTTGAPASGVGINGDLALDAASGVVYEKASNLWSVKAAVGGAGNLTGTASPEGSVTAAAGTFYGRTGSTTGLYYKMSGSGNTGWVTVTTSVPAVTAPGAPTSVTATAGNGTASVTGTAPSSNGGATINRYRATPSVGSAVSAASLPISFTGLTNGTAVTFTLAASNDGGSTYGPESAASNSVTPSAGSGTTSKTLTLNGMPLILNNLNLVM